MMNNYDPARIEADWYRRWEQEGCFKPSGAGKPYAIAIPPPNVTGNLHMGHAFQVTLMDTLVRLQRMRGRNTLWQSGTDHAGIATQLVVERQLEAQQTSRASLGREAFVEKVWEWKRESGGQITEQLRQLGASVDWSRERFTLDEDFSRAVLEVFVRLYDEGLIYRGKRLVNWDPVLRTAISDLEVENVEEDGHLWHFRYPLADGAKTDAGRDYLVVATTRPETMLGDTAVAVHPRDGRYQSLIGGRVELPLSGRRIPVIADEHVDPEFGTGCVKITPAHDFNDYAMGERHKLKIINIFTDDARLNEQAPEAYRGLDRFEARKKIIAELEAAGLLELVEKHRMTVPRAERSATIVEPHLTDQWFVAIKTLAEPALRAVQEGGVRFASKNYENMYLAWMRDLHDWCISRQLWWGHRIPAWYDENGEVYVARSEAEARKKNGLAEDLPLTRDPDVLETWFSSALWTFGSLGWPKETKALDTWHPTSVLVTGYDIIFFWVARMIMMSLKFTDEVPFRRVYIHGLVRDAEGRKMSKSQGNGLDPLDLIHGIGLEELVQKRTGGLMQPQLAKRIERETRRDFPDGLAAFGADALRFTFCSLATSGRDVRFDTARINGYRNFCNKLWNAARFVLMNTEGRDCGAADAVSLPDRWIRSRLQALKQSMQLHLDNFRFDMAASRLYSFIWEDFCDWYLEMAKLQLREAGESEESARPTRHTLINVLEEVLRLAHPMMPFITEDLWQQVAPVAGVSGKFIMLQPWPEPETGQQDTDAETDMTWLQRLVTGVRNIRGEMNISPGTKIPVWLTSSSQTDRERMKKYKYLLHRLMNARELKWLAQPDDQPAAVYRQDEMQVQVPLAGLIDAEAEVQRLDKELARSQKEMQAGSRKLENPNFVARAPAEVVERTRARLAQLQDEVRELEARKQRLLELA